MRRYFLLLLFANLILSEEISIKGKITDIKTKEDISFTVIRLGDSNKSFLSDIDGEFYYSSNKEFKLTFSAIGYKEKTIIVNANNDSIYIELEKKDSILVYKNGVSVNQIIQNVIRNKNINDPYKYKSFQYESYNKVTLSYEKPVPKKIYNILDLENVKKDTSSSVDQRNIDLENSVYNVIAESFTKRKYLNSKNQENILAIKISGVKDPHFGIIGREFQSFSFYEDIDMLHQHYINPITRYGIDKYNFNLDDTLYYNNDTIFRISFSPLYQNIKGLQGTIFISKDKYAIYAIDIHSLEKIPFVLKQRYKLINDKWFPSELYYKFRRKNTPIISLVDIPRIEEDKDSISISESLIDMITSKYDNINRIYFLEGRNYIKNVIINDYVEDDFSLEEVVLDDMEEKDSSFWVNVRAKELNLIEKNTYNLLDSQKENIVYNRIIANYNLFDREKFIINSNNHLEIYIRDFFRYNNYEGIRINIHLNTSDLFSNIFKTGVFLGYGFSDNSLKYGLNLDLYALKKDKLLLTFRYKRDLVQIGSYNKKFIMIDDIFGYRYDRVEEFKLGFSFRIFKYLKISTDLLAMDIRPKYYIMSQNLNNYNITSLDFNLNFGYKEKFFMMNEKLVSLGTDYPVLNVRYNRGFNNFLNGQLNYNKIEFNLNQEIYSHLGITNYLLEGGYIDRILPYGQMYTGEGANEIDRTGYFYLRNKFQTMGLYEFLSDRYINLFFSHNFNNLLYIGEIYGQNINLDIILENNISYGNIRNTNSISLEGLNFKIKDKIYSECGMMLSLGIIGFGISYRYGYYSYDRFNDNIFYKIGFYISLQSQKVRRYRSNTNTISYMIYSLLQDDMNIKKFD